MTCKKLLMYQLDIARVLGIWEITLTCIKLLLYPFLFCFQSIRPMLKNVNVLVTSCQSIRPMEDVINK